MDEETPHYREEPPFNPLPLAVVALALAIFGIELWLTLGARGYVGGAEAVGWRVQAIQDHAFSGRILSWMIETGRWPLEHVARFLTYPFIHLGFTHALMVIVFLLAMGKLVGDTFGNIAVLVVFFGSAVGGALVFSALQPEATLVGGYPAVYGLIGSYTFMLWLSLGNIGQSRLSAFQLIAFLVGIQLLFGLLFGGNRDWIADLAGFFTGFALSFALVPGAVTRLRDRMRQR